MTATPRFAAVCHDCRADPEADHPTDVPPTTDPTWAVLVAGEHRDRGHEAEVVLA